MLNVGVTTTIYKDDCFITSNLSDSVAFAVVYDLNKSPIGVLQLNNKIHKTTDPVPCFLAQCKLTHEEYAAQPQSVHKNKSRYNFVFRTKKGIMVNQILFVKGNFMFKLFSSKISEDKKLYVVLVGLPCTGKTTWRELILNHLPKETTCFVLSFDDIIFELVQEINRSQEKELPPLTYNDMFNDSYKKIWLERFDIALNQGASLRPTSVGNLVVQYSSVH